METGYKTPNADQRRKNDKACQNQENYNDPRMTVNGDFHQRRNSFDSQQEERRLRGDEVTNFLFYCEYIIIPASHRTESSIKRKRTNEI